MILQQAAQHSSWPWHHLFLSGFLGGSATLATAMRVLNAIVKAMPPLPEGATWGQKWAYQAAQAVSGLDPSTTK